MSDLILNRVGEGEIYATYTDKDKNQKTEELVTGSRLVVLRKTDVTLRFVGKDLVKTRAASRDFSVLTGLKQDATDVTLTNFVWGDKSYTHTINPNLEEHKIDATFTNAHQVDVAVTGGSVAFRAGVLTQGNSAIVLEGNSLKLQFTPDADLGLLPVVTATLDNQEILLDKDYAYTVEHVDSAKTVAVTFEKRTPVQTEITGKTANTIRFTGEPNAEYTVKKPDGTEVKVTTDADGIGQITGLEKGQEYEITHPVHGSVKASTAQMDAKEIADRFKDTSDTTVHNPTSGVDEKAENQKVIVTVDENGNYRVTLKENIDHTVTIPDNWGTVSVDLNGKKIQGDDATETNPARPGLELENGGTTPSGGTQLEIVDSVGGGQIVGGNGSVSNPDGASGIGAGATTPEGVEVIVGAGVSVVGGSGSTDKNGNGGSGGAGISGPIDTIINGGTVTGGAGGNGVDAGSGGSGGAGIDTPNNTVTINTGAANGGVGGNGGDATQGSGGNGGTGGVGVIGTTVNNGTIAGGNGGAGGAGQVPGNGGAAGSAVLGIMTGTGTAKAGIAGAQGQVLANGSMESAKTGDATNLVAIMLPCAIAAVCAVVVLIKQRTRS